MKIPKIERPTAMLIGAIVLGGLAVLLIMQYLKGEKRDYQAQLQSAISRGMVQVVVPTRDVAAGTVASGQNMGERLYPQDLIYGTTITTAKWPKYAGRILARPVQAGKPLLATDFVAGPIADFSSTLPANIRAVTISVDTINSVNGLIRPTDHVDVLLSSRGNNGMDSRVMPLLKHVEVLATGTDIGHEQVEDSGNARAASMNAMRRSYSTMTLAVTPEQASELVLAQQVGPLRVVLSSAHKKAGQADVPMLTQRQLLERLSSLNQGYQRKPHRKSSDSVQFIIGNVSGGVQEHSMSRKTAIADAAPVRTALETAGAQQPSAASSPAASSDPALPLFPEADMPNGSKAESSPFSGIGIE